MSIYSDLSLTLGKHPGTYDVLKNTDVSAVKESIKNILLSGPFDSPFDPNFGGSLRRLLFEQATPSIISVTKRQMIISISTYEPRAIIEDLYIGENLDNGVNVGILFTVIGNPEQQKLNFILERVR